MKLTLGDRIKVHGWVMLKNIEDSQSYEVVRVDEHPGRRSRGVYYFRRIVKNGALSKRMWGHYIDNVDCWIDAESRNNNWIEKTA